MKQITALILSLLFLATQTACSVPKNEANIKIGSVTGKESSETQLGEEESKVLVAYFSTTGTTESIAQDIAGETGASLYKIEAETPYTSADLNYSDPASRATREQKDLSIRPEISSSVVNMEDYDVVFLGYPIWWGQAPRIISTFLERYDFKGKTIIPFCTSHSSKIGSSADDLHRLCSDSATWLPGERFSKESTRESVKEWINSLDIQTNENLKSVLLNSGYVMPTVGLGTYSLLDDVCVNSVSEALKAGYRLIDTANIYHNEESVGKGIWESKVPREEIFITTKLYMNQYDHAEEAIEEALQKLNVDYIDLMLLHHPGENDVKAYKAMEKAVEEGKIRSIGLSNYYVKELEGFIPQISIMPAVVQNEIHPYYQENDVIPYIQGKGIVMEGWYPLGGRGYTGELLNDETILKIAKEHGKSSAQIILRWNLQKGVVVIPGSSNPEHIKENIDLFNFELTEEEMAKINGLDRKEKHDWY